MERAIGVVERVRLGESKKIFVKCARLFDVMHVQSNVRETYDLRARGLIGRRRGRNRDCITSEQWDRGQRNGGEQSRNEREFHGSCLLSEYRCYAQRTLKQQYCVGRAIK